MAKVSNAEREQRIQTIYEMIIKGATRPFILRYSSEKWEISDRTIDTYIKNANDRIQAVFNNEEKIKIINKHRAQLSDLYVKNYKIEDFRECRNILESEAKLLGLEAPREIKNYNENKEVDNFDYENARRIIEEDEKDRNKE